MSVNNVFLMAGEPVIRFVKAIPSRVAGMRLDPMTEDFRPITFILETDDEDPEGEILCLYSEKELQYFKQANKSLIKMGLFKPYDESKSTVNSDTPVMFTDEDVRKIASIKTSATMEKKLADIDSYALIIRVKTMAEEIGQTVKNMKLIEQREQELR